MHVGGYDVEHLVAEHEGHDALAGDGCERTVVVAAAATQPVPEPVDGEGRGEHDLGVSKIGDGCTGRLQQAASFDQRVPAVVRAPRQPARRHDRQQDRVARLGQLVDQLSGRRLVADRNVGSDDGCVHGEPDARASDQPAEPVQLRIIAPRAGSLKAAAERGLVVHGVRASHH